MSAVALAYSYESAPKPVSEPASEIAPQSGLVARVSELLEKADFRYIQSDEERAAVGRLRYDAYLREGAIESDPLQSFIDSHDDDKNARTFGVYIDDELAASIRIHVVTKDNPDSPSVASFSDVLGPELEAGKTIIDPNRFVTNQRLARLYPTLPYVTLRACWMAAKYFNAEHTLAAVRPEHQAFYRRVFKHRPICGPRPYLPLIKPLTLMTTDYREITDYVYRRYPFFHSTYFERRALFERHAPLVPATVPLSPVPAEQLQLFAQAG